MNSRELISAIRAASQRYQWDREWRGVEAVVDRDIIAGYDRGGFNSLDELIHERTVSPYVASALVYLSHRRRFSVLRVFSEEELLQGTLAHLRSPSSFEHLWAWRAMWFGHLSEEDHWRLVLDLIDRVPDDDDMLWQIADGPVAELEMLPHGVERLKDLARSNEKLARVLRLAQESP